MIVGEIFHLQTNLCSSLHFVLHSARSLTGTVTTLLESWVAR